MATAAGSLSAPVSGSVSEQTRRIDREATVVGGWIHERSAMAGCAESGRWRLLAGVVDLKVHRPRTGDYVLV
jgi:hypothetical protein